METRETETESTAKERLIQETLHYLFGLEIRELETVRKVAKNLYYLEG